MDPTTFDALSRFLGGDVSRRALLARLAGGLAPWAPFLLRGEVVAKKKHRRKRKRKRNHANRCPDGLVACDGQCALPNLAHGCLFGGQTCCSNRCYLDVCIPCPGRPCAVDDDCCDGLPCLDTNDPNAGHTCGGCLHGNVGACQSADDCCSAECNSGVCYSRLGERCASVFDCISLPRGIVDCVGGVCICPSECCEDTDCTSPRVCRGGACTCLTECCFDTDCLPAEQCLGGECKPRTGG